MKLIYCRYRSRVTLGPRICYHLSDSKQIRLVPDSGHWVAVTRKSITRGRAKKEVDTDVPTEVPCLAFKYLTEILNFVFYSGKI